MIIIKMIIGIADSSLPSFLLFIVLTPFSPPLKLQPFNFRYKKFRLLYPLGSSASPANKKAATRTVFG
jgi:hypothetical protein